MAKPIWGMVPPGGWHYQDGDVRLEGWSLDNLYDVVRNYRAENNLPLGDVVGDVNSFVCGNFPNYCHGVDMVVVTSIEQPNQQTELLTDITVWAKNTLTTNKRIDFVTDELAEARAKICARCPKNVKWRSGCQSCITATDRLSVSIRQARETKTSRSLGGCSIMRHDNRSAVFFDKNNFNKPQNLPAKCWLNQ
jgi:hypothetical protein